MAELTRQEYAQLPVAELKVHPRNPRQGDVGAIFTSIEVNGFYGAVVVQRSSRYVLAGNHRLQAAIQAGLKEVPCVVVDVDDAQALRILLADNRTSDLGDYNQDTLAALLEELAGSDEGLEGTGYDGDDLDALLAELNPPEVVKAAREKERTRDLVPETHPGPVQAAAQERGMGEIRLIYNRREFELVSEQLRSLMERENLDTHGDAVVYLLTKAEGMLPPSVELDEPR